MSACVIIVIVVTVDVVDVPVVVVTVDVVTSTFKLTLLSRDDMNKFLGTLTFFHKVSKGTSVRAFSFLALSDSSIVGPRPVI